MFTGGAGRGVGILHTRRRAAHAGGVVLILLNQLAEGVVGQRYLVQHGPLFCVAES